MQRATSDTAADALLAMAVKQMQGDVGGSGSGAPSGRGAKGVDGGAIAAALRLPEDEAQGGWPLLRWGSSSSRSCSGRAPVRPAARPPVLKGEPPCSAPSGREHSKGTSVSSISPLWTAQAFKDATGTRQGDMQNASRR